MRCARQSCNLTYTDVVHYEVWDTQTGNLVGEYDAEDQVLDAVQRLVASGWPAEHLALPRK